MSPLKERAVDAPRPPIIGHIRLGFFASGRPQQSRTFIFTSPQSRYLAPLAREYGGEVEAYTPQGGSEDRYRLISEAEAIRVLLPFDSWDRNLSQFHELWGRSGIQRRCDGQDVVLTDVDEQTGDISKTTEPCLCDPDDRTCSTTSRIHCWMPQAGLGVWLLTTNSEIASYSLEGEMKLLDRAFAEKQTRVPVELSLREREIFYVGDDGKRHSTKKNIVHVDLAMELPQALEIVESGGELGGVQALLASGKRPALNSGSATAQPAPAAPETPKDEGVATGEGSPPSPWVRYQQALAHAATALDVDESEARRLHVLPLAREKGFTYPPREGSDHTWLNAAAAALEEITAKTAQLEMEDA